VEARRDELRRAAIGRSLVRSPSLAHALERLGYVQADPIRAPARAQDLILRVRVPGYRAGDLDRAYRRLPVEEDVLVNYGYVTRRVQRLLHPRPDTIRPAIDRDAPGLVARVHAFVLEHGPSHPRDVERALGVGRVGNPWGGVSQATTRALAALHHRGRLRVAWREDGIKVYEAARPPDGDPLDPAAAAAAVVALVVDQLAPIPARSLTPNLVRYGAGHLLPEARRVIAEARSRWPYRVLDGERYLWPPDADPGVDLVGGAGDRVRFLAPFDPVVWDRRRFELLWGWEYRFEAYTPPAQRRYGYYALPLLWRDAVVGWVNAGVRDGRLVLEAGAPDGRLPASRAFIDAYEAEAVRFARFRGVAR
jgi:uncharacterized protein YcaQ